ncbi:MAG: hypothetical protein NUW01_02725 [Gemmatimonadaceae bacterium]|nr:hypothetical protein [Gemmatimonadaceae bacterium]
MAAETIHGTYDIAEEFDCLSQGTIRVEWEDDGPESDELGRVFERVEVWNTHGLITFRDLASGADMSFDLDELLKIARDAMDVV